MSTKNFLEISSLRAPAAKEVRFATKRVRIICRHFKSLKTSSGALHVAAFTATRVDSNRTMTDFAGTCLSTSERRTSLYQANRSWWGPTGSLTWRLQKIVREAVSLSMSIGNATGCRPDVGLRTPVCVCAL